MWEKYGTAGQTTDKNTTRRMRIACRITKVTGTHSEHVITIPFPRQQWLCERASVLRYTYKVVLNRTVMQLSGNKSKSTGQIYEWWSINQSVLMSILCRVLRTDFFPSP
jgi:hypothetical protein